MADQVLEAAKELVASDPAAAVASLRKLVFAEGTDAEAARIKEQVGASDRERGGGACRGADRARCGLTRRIGAASRALRCCAAPLVPVCAAPLHACRHSAAPAMLAPTPRTRPHPPGDQRAVGRVCEDGRRSRARGPAGAAARVLRRDPQGQDGQDRARHHRPDHKDPRVHAAAGAPRRCRPRARCRACWQVRRARCAGPLHCDAAGGSSRPAAAADYPPPPLAAAR